MSFGEAIRSVFSKYATFRGRARRSEYWYFILFTILISIPASVIDEVIAPRGGGGPVSGLLSLGLLLPQLAVTVRRIHDTGRSGFWLLGFYAYVIVAVAVAVGAGVGGAYGGAGGSGQANPSMFAVLGLLVLVGFGYGVWMFILTVLNGDAGENKYGADPKGPNVEVFS